MTDWTRYKQEDKLDSEVASKQTALCIDPDHSQDFEQDGEI